MGLALWGAWTPAGNKSNYSPVVQQWPANWCWLASVGVLNSVSCLFYYLKIVMAMWWRRPTMVMRIRLWQRGGMPC